MKTPAALRLIGFALTAMASACAAAVDTSAWKCETCPFEKGASGVVEAGAGAVSDRSPRYGDYTGLDRRGFVILGGQLRWRDDDGRYAIASGSDLGLDSRSLGAEIGREGTVAFTLGYDELPRHRGEGTLTPFTGIGSSVLGLPAGYPAATTAAMPLATTLRPVDIGFQRDRLDLAATWAVSDRLSVRVGARRDTREGSWVGAGSFFANASQLVLPLDHTTEQIDAVARYDGGRLQLSAGYLASAFRNGNDAVSWQNPFTPIVRGADRATLALAPDNQFHQLQLAGGYSASSAVRLSGELAVGRMTQDSGFVPFTGNASLASAALPAQSLNGRASTLDANLRLNARLGEQWRMLASLAHNERQNDTPVAVYPGLATDMFVTPPAANVAYSFKTDRARLQLDRRRGAWAFAAGADHDITQRPEQDAGTTRETRVWSRLTTPLAGLGTLALRAAHAERNASSYSAVTVAPPAENPLLRRFNMADRQRDSAGARADLQLGDAVSIGIDGEAMRDDYQRSAVGLREARVAALGGDIAVALSDTSSVHAFIRGERTRSLHSGSQGFTLPDWSGRVDDRVELIGLGARHAALGGKLEIAADLMIERSRSQMVVDPGSATPAYPSVRSPRDSLAINATYKLAGNASIAAGYAYERRNADDWRFDGVLPASVSNLLALGETAPRYEVHVLRLMWRYRF